MNGFEEFLATAGRKLSKEQLQVVYSDVATVVSAGAGSGKTTVLSYRFLRLVMEKKAKVDEILTLTFTKKAAAEMYERIFSLLSIAAESAPDVREEIQGLANAYISTLDSFSNEIARTDSARYGISRAFEVLSEDDEDKLVESIVLSLYENHKDKMLPLSRLYNPDTVSSDLFLPLSREINILTDFDAESTRNIYLSFLSRIEKKFIEYANSVLNEIEALKSPDMDDSFLFSKGEQSISYIRTLLSSGESCNLPQFNLTQLRAKKFALIRDVIKEKWRPALPLLNSLRCNKDSDFSYMEVFSLFVSSLNREKRLRGELTFSDISAVALTILKENPTVRSYYKRKFKYIMIDEFQDNSSEQKDLLYILSEKWDVNGLGVPDKRELDNTKLFFVGDDAFVVYFANGVFNVVEAFLRQVLVRVFPVIAFQSFEFLLLGLLVDFIIRLEESHDAVLFFLDKVFILVDGEVERSLQQAVFPWFVHVELVVELPIPWKEIYNDRYRTDEY